MSQFIKIYFTSSMLNMFRTLIHPSSGACDFSIESPHWSCVLVFDVCWSFGVSGLGWYLCSRPRPGACYTDTTPFLVVQKQGSNVACARRSVAHSDKECTEK